MSGGSDEHGCLCGQELVSLSCASPQAAASPCVCVTTVWSACIFNTFPCFCHAVFLVDSISSSLGNSSPLTSSADCTTLLPVVVPKPACNKDVYSGEKC